MTIYLILLWVYRVVKAVSAFQKQMQSTVKSDDQYVKYVSINSVYTPKYKAIMSVQMLLDLANLCDQICLELSNFFNMHLKFKSAHNVSA